MTNFFERILGSAAVEKERELARRLEASGAEDVEVVGRGAIVTSKESLASSNTVRLMRVRAREIVSEQTNMDK
ncbi:hypothetical protein ACI51Z_00680 [Pectobacterium carotovorum]|uniref:hypothetical protein n=1 Tax=Pectobacterium TaxID=122277 RepID=UPI000CD00ED3|nr:MULTISPECIES: hypothetical protein [Pectobacterium]MBA0177502.1 hypothetical protein [Pectobacterium carotovorum]MBA0189789.1 hypothetical protein [Pectobacterium odoriferum]POD89867.1 hypothetical protein BV925_20315 [Pectobacterium odoriferum]